VSGFGGEDSALIARWSAPGRTRIKQRTGLRRRLTGLLLLLLALGVFALGAAIAFLGVRLGPVLSGSMRPGIQPGDLVITAPVAVTALRPGDVISFFPPGRDVPVIHRLTSITARDDGTWITTKGDANDVADPWGEIRLIDKRAWRLVATVPVVGFIPIWTQSLRGPLLVVAGLVLAVSAALAFRRPGVSMHPNAARGH
jgi:signal peptidase